MLEWLDLWTKVLMLLRNKEMDHSNLMKRIPIIGSNLPKLLAQELSTKIHKQKVTFSLTYPPDDLLHANYYVMRLNLQSNFQAIQVLP